jgi:hypothetical protein
MASIGAAGIPQAGNALKSLKFVWQHLNLS